MAQIVATRIEDGRSVVDAGGEQALAVAGAKLVVPLAADEVGTWFEAPKPDPDAEPESRTWSQSLELRYGDRTVNTDEARFLEAVALGERDGRQLLTFANACGRFTFSSDTKQRQPTADDMKEELDRIDALRKGGGRFLASPNGGAFVDDEDDETDAWGGLAGDPQWVIEAGTPLSWTDGRPAGKVLVKAELADSLVEAREDKLCFEVAALRVCVDADKAARGDAAAEDYGVGGLGLVGTGSGEGKQSKGTMHSKGSKDDDEDEGGGGFGFGGQGRALPSISQGKATVSAGLTPEAIRRVVRAHINELNSCYNAGLERQGDLAGKIVLHFVITAKGTVGASVVGEDSLSPAGSKVGSCMAKAVKRWMFPATEGDNVTVDYPLTLSPG